MRQVFRDYVWERLPAHFDDMADLPGILHSCLPTPRILFRIDGETLAALSTRGSSEMERAAQQFKRTWDAAKSRRALRSGP